MSDTTTSATQTTQDTPPAPVAATEPERHGDHFKDVIKDAAEKIVARVEHERSEHEHAAHEGRVHHAKEAIQDAIDKVSEKLPGKR